MTTHKLICPYCTYSENSPKAKECELCGTALNPISAYGSVSSQEKLNSLAKRQELPPRKQTRNAIKAIERIKYLVFILLGLAIGLRIGSSASLRDCNKIIPRTQPAETSAVNHLKLV